MRPIVELRQPQPRLPELQWESPIAWAIYPNQHWAILGENGAGKSLVADLLQSRYALRSGEVVVNLEGSHSELIKRIAFKDIHSYAQNREGYYQQRFHATENDHVPTVGESLALSGSAEEVATVVDLLGIAPLLGSRLVYLSSGELRKFLIAKTLVKRPRLLILDNPFIGLDPPSRQLLNALLEQLITQSGVQIVLLLSNPEDIPSSITHLLLLKEKRDMGQVSCTEFWADETLQQALFASPIGDEKIALPSPTRAAATHEETVRLEDVHAAYGARTILQGVEWRVRNGEKWALLGRNGSGKSTLLSLINADHPQSYANRIYLFDKRRGSGESIWEIKQRIGFISPEMHLYYNNDAPALAVVGSGFFDSVGMYNKCTESQLAHAREWMELFGIAHLAERTLLSLSSGEQRLVLLARTFVKDPDLLILDEPLHGLDCRRKRFVRRIIEAFCQRPSKTLIYVTHYLNEIPSCVDQQFELTKVEASR